MTDEQTEAWWADRFVAAHRRCRHQMARINHERRAALIMGSLDGTLSIEDQSELDHLQAACDAALAESDQLRLDYLAWQMARVADGPGDRE